MRKCRPKAGQLPVLQQLLGVTEDQLVSSDNQPDGSPLVPAAVPCVPCMQSWLSS